MSKIDELMSMIEDGEAVIAALREEIKHAKEQGAKELAELIIDKYYPGQWEPNDWTKLWRESQK